VYRPARSEKVIGMTILGRAGSPRAPGSGGVPRPSEHAFAAAEPLPDHIPRIIEAIKTRAAAH